MRCNFELASPKHFNTTGATYLLPNQDTHETIITQVSHSVECADAALPLNRVHYRDQVTPSFASKKTLEQIKHDAQVV